MWPDALDGTGSASTADALVQFAKPAPLATRCTSNVSSPHAPLLHAGTQKKGKAARQALELLVRGPAGAGCPREAELMKQSPEMDAINTMVRGA